MACGADLARDHIRGQDADRFGRRPTVRRVASELMAHWDHPGPRRRIQPDAAVGFLDLKHCCRGIRWSFTPRDWHEHAGRECHGQMGGAKGLAGPKQLDPAE